jgi:fatty-acyl-CoA synthase
VLEVAVVGHPDARWGEVPVALGATAMAGVQLEGCRARLARFQVAEEITFVHALPRNPLGKVLKSELRIRQDPSLAVLPGRLGVCGAMSRNPICHG